MERRRENGRQVRTTDTVFRILETLHEEGGCGITELADHLGLAKSTVHKHLNTLYDREYVIRDGDTYMLGLRFVGFGQHAIQREAIFHVKNPSMSDLAEETGEYVWLVVEEHGLAVYIDSAYGDRAVRTHGSIGKRAHMHDIASGKAILANLPDERVDEIIDRHGLPESTPNTITDRAALRDELEAIAESGVAFNDNETIEGMRAVAAPVIVDDVVHGSLCVAGPTKRLTGEHFRSTIPDLVMGATNAIELELMQA